MVGNDETLTGTPEQEYALAADFIRGANKCQKAFVKTFSEGE